MLSFSAHFMLVSGTEALRDEGPVNCHSLSGTKPGALAASLRPDAEAPGVSSGGLSPSRPRPCLSHQPRELGHQGDASAWTQPRCPPPPPNAQSRRAVCGGGPPRCPASRGARERPVHLRVEESLRTMGNGCCQVNSVPPQATEMGEARSLQGLLGCGLWLPLWVLQGVGTEPSAAHTPR